MAAALGAADDNDNENWRLEIETLNCTSSQQAKVWLEDTRASVVLLQEIGTPESGLDDFLGWCTAHG